MDGAVLGAFKSLGIRECRRLVLIRICEVFFLNLSLFMLFLIGVKGWIRVFVRADCALLSVALSFI